MKYVSEEQVKLLRYLGYFFLVFYLDYILYYIGRLEKNFNRSWDYLLKKLLERLSHSGSKGSIDYVEF